MRQARSLLRTGVCRRRGGFDPLKMQICVLKHHFLRTLGALSLLRGGMLTLILFRRPVVSEQLNAPLKTAFLRCF
jgi:hypothetical protein